MLPNYATWWFKMKMSPVPLYLLDDKEKINSDTEFLIISWRAETISQ